MAAFPTTLRTRVATALCCLAASLVMGGGSCLSGGTGPGSSGSSSSGGGGGGGFDAGVVDNTCVRDQQCAAGLVCGADGGCAAGKTCATNANCGECEPGGTEDCGYPQATSYCDTAAGVCRRVSGSCEPCTASSECGFNEQLGLSNVCLRYADGQSYCGLACQGTCSEGFQCNRDAGACEVAPAVGSCSGAVTCMGDVDCPTGTHCTTYAANPPRRGVCLHFCLYDNECPADRRCQTQPGASFGQCIQKCTPGATAGSTQICHEWGTYGPKCPATACPAGFECSSTTEGYCKQPGCDTDDECLLARTICDTQTRECVPGCNDVDDCGAFELCTGGMCVDQGCRGKELSCNLGQFCCGKEIFSPGEMACPTGVATGDCFNAPDPFCRQCEDENGCSDIMQHGQASHCYDLQRSTADGGSESIGKFCSVGCRDDNDCPRGIRCKDLPAGENGEMVKGCLDNVCALIAQ